MLNINWFVLLTLLSLPLTTGVEDKLTAGRVALLVEPNGAPDVAQLKAAVADADPAVRAVAARVVGVLGRADLAPSLQELIERELDATAAAEQIRALLSLKAGDGLPQATAGAARLGRAAVEPLGEWLARNDPQRFAASVPELIKMSDAQPIIGRLGAMGLRQTPAARDAIVSALATAGSGPAWDAFLDALRGEVGTDILRKGLTSASASVRETTVWFIVVRSTDRTEIADDLKALASESAKSSRPDDTAWTSFGLDILGRRAGEKGTDHSTLITQQAKDHRAELSQLARHSELSATERAAFEAALPGVSTSVEKPAPNPASNPVAGDASTSPSLRTRMFRSIAPGFLTSLLEAVRCSPSGGSSFGAARISYRLDGHPNSVGLDASTLSPACETFLRVLTRLTVAHPSARIAEGDSQWLYLAMDKESIACLDADPKSSTRTAADARRVGGGGIMTPHKIKDVRPLYPPSMQQARIQGSVLIEATISTTGCVTNGEVLRSVELPLDLAAMKAVSGWRFEPTLLDGAPVPIVMTVTVMFKLQ